MLVIGITGTLGAGKGTVVKYLVERYGFTHHSVRDYLTRELVRTGSPINRDTMVALADELRTTRHPAYIAEVLYQQAMQTSGNAVIESVRAIGEVNLLKKQPNFYLLGVDADQRTRYQRIALRKSATDLISWERFVEDEKREIVDNDPTRGNLLACITRADFVLNNDGTFETLHKQVDVIMSKVLGKNEGFELSPTNL